LGGNTAQKKPSGNSHAPAQVSSGLRVAPLDATLIRRANESNWVFDFGNMPNEWYLRDLAKIDAYTSVSADEKERMKQRIRGLREKELATQGRAIGAHTYGVGRINHTRDVKNFNAADIVKTQADSFMANANEVEWKFHGQERDRVLLSTLREAAGRGDKQIVFDGKTYYRRRTNWSLMPPVAKGSKPSWKT
jgi:hypothetical protein